RFDKLDPKEHKGFLNKVYTKRELAYCFSKQRPAQHLAARFCAKESIVKAFSNAGVKGVYFSDIETTPSGGALVVKKNWNVALSMSHADDVALAMAIVSKP